MIRATLCGLADGKFTLEVGKGGPKRVCRSTNKLDYSVESTNKFLGTSIWPEYKVEAILGVLD